MRKNQLKLAFIFLFLTPLIACNSQQQKDKAEEKALQAKILTVHDKIMPQMETIVHQRQELKKLQRSIGAVSAAHPSFDTTALKLKIGLAIRNLDSADHTMMNWMDGLNLNFDKQTHPQIMTYLRLQYANVNKVDSSLQKALTESTSLEEKAKK